MAELQNIIHNFFLMLTKKFLDVSYKDKDSHFFLPHFLEVSNLFPQHKTWQKYIKYFYNLK